MEPLKSRIVIDGQRAPIVSAGRCYWNGQQWVIDSWHFDSVNCDRNQLAWHEMEQTDGSWSPYTIAGWSVEELAEFTAGLASFR